MLAFFFVGRKDFRASRYPLVSGAFLFVVCLLFGSDPNLMVLCVFHKVLSHLPSLFVGCKNLDYTLRILQFSPAFFQDAALLCLVLDFLVLTVSALCV